MRGGAAGGTIFSASAGGANHRALRSRFTPVGAKGRFRAGGTPLLSGAIAQALGDALNQWAEPSHQAAIGNPRRGGGPPGGSLFFSRRRHIRGRRGPAARCSPKGGGDPKGANQLPPFLSAGAGTSQPRFRFPAQPLPASGRLGRARKGHQQRRSTRQPSKFRHYHRELAFEGPRQTTQGKTCDGVGPSTRTKTTMLPPPHIKTKVHEQDGWVGTKKSAGTKN